MQILLLFSYFNSFSNRIVHLYHAFENNKCLYLVLNYFKNGTLATKINDMIKFTIETVRYYAAEILLASEVMNSQGVIHRDLKQKSILLGDNWHIVLKDFGCATILKEQRAMLRRRKNSFVGNTKYLRPKMVQDTKRCTTSADLWELGCILYEMLTSKSRSKPLADT